MIKKLIKWILLFSLVVVLAACGMNDEGYQAEEQVEPDVEPQEPQESEAGSEVPESEPDVEPQNQVEVEYIRISPQEAEEMMLTEDVVILDVRSQEEFDAGYIPGAVLLPVSDVRERATSIISDFEQIILVYCAAGSRSATAARTLIEMGYTRVYDFGGINGWYGEIVVGG